MRPVPFNRIVGEIYRKGGIVGLTKHCWMEYPEICLAMTQGMVGLGLVAYMTIYNTPYQPPFKYPGGIAVLRPDNPIVEYLPKDTTTRS